jgi:hypothetical protein
MFVEAEDSTTRLIFTRTIRSTLEFMTLARFSRGWFAPEASGATRARMGGASPTRVDSELGHAARRPPAD